MCYNYADKNDYARFYNDSVLYHVVRDRREPTEALHSAELQTVQNYEKCRQNIHGNTQRPRKQTRTKRVISLLSYNYCYYFRKFNIVTRHAVMNQ